MSRNSPSSRTGDVPGLRRSRYLLPWAGLGLATLVAGACGPGVEVAVWPVDSLEKVFPDTPPGAAGPARVRAARNEYVNAQLAVRAGQQVEELNVEASPPRLGERTLPCTVRWADYVSVRSNPPKTPPEELVRPAPGPFPDPLRESFPFSLKAGETHAIWVTVFVPAETPPGPYSASVKILSASRTVQETPLEVTVTEAAVPAEPSLRVTNWFSLNDGNLGRFYNTEEYSDAYWNVIANLARVMAEHRQSVILTPVVALAQPSYRDGKVVYDFSRLDRWVRTFDEAGVNGLIEGGHLLGRRSGYDTPVVVPSWFPEYGKFLKEPLAPEDPRVRQFMEGFLPALYSHIGQRGWKDRYIQHVLDEPHGDEPAIYERYARLIRRHMPGIRTVDAIDLSDDLPFMDKYLDIWVPVLGRFDDRLEAIRAHQARGGEVWFYTCVFPQGAYLNRFIDQSLLKVRLLHWFNFRHQLTGYLHWGGNYWTDQPFDDVQKIINDGKLLLPAGDNAIVYPQPTKSSVLSSIRLEAMRDGIEDYELLRALEARDPAKAAALAAEAIPQITDYVRDVKVFRGLHERLLGAWE